MNNIQKRFLLFLLGCIVVRSLLVYIAKIGNEKILKLLSVFTFVVAIGFIYRYVSGSRKTGPEVFDDVIWWNHLRPVHFILYLLFSILVIVFKQYNSAWIVLLVDVLIGLVSFLIYHIKSGNYKMLLS
jgi:hypothetical protein